MKLIAKSAIAALAVAAVATPALADEWVYHGGPKSPDSLSWYQSEDYPGYYGNYAYDADAGPYHGGPRYVVPDDDD